MYGICRQFSKGYVRSIVFIPDIRSGARSGVESNLELSDVDFITFEDQDEASDFSDFLSDYVSDDFFVVEV